MRRRYGGIGTGRCDGAIETERPVGPTPVDIGFGIAGVEMCASHRPGLEIQGLENYGPKKYGPKKYGPKKYGPKEYGAEKYGPEIIGLKSFCCIERQCRDAAKGVPGFGNHPDDLPAARHVESCSSALSADDGRRSNQCESEALPTAATRKCRDAPAFASCTVINKRFYRSSRPAQCATRCADPSIATSSGCNTGQTVPAWPSCPRYRFRLGSHESAPIL